MDLSNITKRVIDLSKNIGDFIKIESEKFNSGDIEKKGLHDLVTYVDKQAEEMLVGELRKLLPEAGFIAEEDQSLKRAERYNWIVDPLDGTTNFIHSIPVFSISIALMDGDELIMGLVYEINQKECFYSWKGAPAYLNGKVIRVSPQEKLDDSLLATGFPYHDYSLLNPYLELFKDLMQTTRGVRRLGSAAVDLAYVAAGRFELFYEYGLNSWDVAAGAFLVQQAGGEVTDFKGYNNFVFGRQIISSNGKTHKEFIDKLTSFFY